MFYKLRLIILILYTPLNMIQGVDFLNSCFLLHGMGTR